MSAWLTIEVQHGDISAERWRRAHGERLTEAAITNGAIDWLWHLPQWGVVLELAFSEEAARDDFRHLPAVTAALDATPDPIRGLYVYPGRGGGSTSGVPRRPSPTPAQDAAALEAELYEAVDLTGEHPRDVVDATRGL